MKPYLLQGEEIKELAAKIPGWEIHKKYIEKNIVFQNFIEAFSFMTKVALIAEKYNHHPNWENIYSQVNIKFQNFVDAFSFITKVALLAEKYNHHPNWENVYSQVRIKLFTHDLGGISNLDHVMASEINNLLK